jgi:hypothetical protein
MEVRTLDEIALQLERIAKVPLPADVAGPIIAIEAAVDKWKKTRKRP